MITLGVDAKVAVPSPAVMDAAAAAAGMGEGGSTWRTPLPYLFGGLAAMFFLIATSLLFLAYSYWKYTNRLERSERERIDLEAAGGDGGGAVKAPYVEKFVVIMPGDENPTWLASPRCFRAFDSDEVENGGVGFEVVEKVKTVEAEAETTSYEEVDRRASGGLD